MYIKILIKWYVLIFVVNLALVGVFLDIGWVVGLSIVNTFFLFAILIKERKAFADTKQRVLFNADVFRFVSLGVGIWGTKYLDMGRELGSIYFWLLILGIGSAFYLLMLLFFRMYRGSSLFKDISAKIALFCVLLTILLSLSYSGGGTGNSLLGTLEKTGKEWIHNLSSISLFKKDSFSKKQSEDAVKKMGDIRTNTSKKHQVEKDMGTFASGGVEKDIKKDISLSGQSSGTQIEIEEKKVVSSIFDTSNIDPETKLTFGNFLPLLVQTYNLPASPHSYDFSYIGTNNDLYPVFAIARDYNMIGNATRPDQEIRCKHLMVLLGLAEERELTYNASNVFEVFWKEAGKRGYTDHGCEEINQTAMIKNLP